MRLPRRGPDRANKVAKAIPMKRIPWDTAEPGHFEIDLVHHSGPSSSGLPSVSTLAAVPGAGAPMNVRTESSPGSGFPMMPGSSGCRASTTPR